MSFARGDCLFGNHRSLHRTWLIEHTLILRQREDSAQHAFAVFEHRASMAVRAMEVRENIGPVNRSEGSKSHALQGREVRFPKPLISCDSRGLAVLAYPGKPMILSVLSHAESALRLCLAAQVNCRLKALFEIRWIATAVFWDSLEAFNFSFSFLIRFEQDFLLNLPLMRSHFSDTPHLENAKGVCNSAIEIDIEEVSGWTVSKPS